MNIPRYIDTQEEEDIQDLNAHLNGGIPKRDVDSLNDYWLVYPTLKKQLFEPLRERYSQLKVDTSAIKETIFSHNEFVNYGKDLDAVFDGWKNQVKQELEGISLSTKPKTLIFDVAEKLLASYENKALIDRYDIYQHLMNYWNEVMKDDVYMLIEDGWVAKVRRMVEKNAKGKEVDQGWTCDLIPKSLIIQVYLAKEQAELQQVESELESLQAELTNYEEEHGGEEGVLADAVNDKGKLTKATVAKRMKEIKSDKAEKEAYELLQTIEKLFDKTANLSKELKDKTAQLDELCMKQYDLLNEADVKRLVIEKKWMSSIQTNINGEIDAISQRLTARIKELGERYDDTLGAIDANVKELEEKVNEHLQKMGLVWN
jgi:type I restriction enzyme M protein